MMHDQMIALKVGDTICDCNYRHQEVISIEDELFSNQSLYRYFDWLPLWCHDILEKIWPKYVGDKALILKDGSSCSAIHCADIVPHYGKCGL